MQADEQLATIYITQTFCIFLGDLDQRLYLKDNRREPNIWCFSQQSNVLERILHISSESQHTSNIRQKCSEKIFAAGEVIKDCTESGLSTTRMVFMPRTTRLKDIFQISTHDPFIG